MLLFGDKSLQHCIKVTEFLNEKASNSKRESLQQRRAGVTCTINIHIKSKMQHKSLNTSQENYQD